MSEIKLYGDALDRGKYAYTLFRIISEYAPKRPYEVVGTLPVIEEDEDDDDNGDNDAYLSKETIIREDGQMSFPRKANAPARERSYSSKLKHLDNEAFIMSISASWGSGKTTFMHMFADMLRGNVLKASPDIEAFIEKNYYYENDVAILDAWKNDFYEDPLNPLYKALVDKLYNDDKAKEEAWKKLKDYKGELENKDGQCLSLDDKIKDMHDFIKKAIKQKTRQGKLIVIIDELDRCRPTFAIKLLEIVKHLFNIRGIVFVFFLDITQLQHSVKKVYGRGFDALGYLERFFDYSSLMPRGERSLMFKSLAMEYDIAAKEDVNDFYDICQSFDLAAREMKAVCSSFHYLNKHELKNYPSYAKKLYFYLLALKYKCSDEVQQLDSSYNNAKAREDLFTRHHWPACLDCAMARGAEQPLMTAFKENAVIKKGKYQYLKEGKPVAGKRYSLSEGKKLVKDSNDSLSGVLFQNDLNVQGMENMRLLEYMFRKIELYDTVIGSEAKDETLKPGTVVKFGHWPLTKDGAEGPIEWQVLSVEDNKALLLSRYALEVLPYNDEEVKVTWETCSLRKWLYNEKNEKDPRTFYGRAFDEDEKALILKENVKAEKNLDYDTDPGNDTQDKVFLLSVQEAKRYLPSRKKRVCELTEYALEERRQVYERYGRDDLKEVYGKNPRCVWWLRSPGDYGIIAAFVYYDGSVNAYAWDVKYGDFAVRLALWLILHPESSHPESPQSA